MSLEQASGGLGMEIKDFNLPGVDGGKWALKDVRGEKGTLVMFICNHCPYVQGAIGRIVRDANELAAHGVKCVAICSNDADVYPEDSFDNMKKFSDAHDMPFPYLHDEDQSVAEAYHAVCTPDFFGFNADGVLEYRGRIDAGGIKEEPHVRRDLFEAMKQIAETGKGPEEQHASMGCSIKWK